MTPTFQHLPRDVALQAAQEPVPAPAAYQPPVFSAYLNGTATGATANHTVCQLVGDRLQFTLLAFTWASYMERYGSLETAIATLGQTRPVIGTLRLHTKLADHELEGQEWSARHGFASHPPDPTLDINEPEWLAIEKWRERTPEGVPDEDEVRSGGTVIWGHPVDTH